MTDSGEPRPRARVAEARRNRRALLDCATAAFASGEQSVSLEAIARDAGVGIGTLYRHFPRRELLVEAVYADQVERLGATARRLLARYEPAEALRRWCVAFVDWAATKHGMTDALQSLMASGRLDAGQLRSRLVAIVALFLEAGAAAGDLRRDVRAEDVAATLAAVLTVAGEPRQRAQAKRMTGLIVDGLRRR